MVSLVGLPGSGKSSVARLLGKYYGWGALDTDALIEARIGMPIKEYFSTHGEASFREVETEVLAECVASRKANILATGGGIVLAESNRLLLHERTLCFYLRTNPEELARRLRSDTQRPLLQNTSASLKIRELSRIRHPLYLQTAHYVVEAGRPNVWALVHWICMQLELGGYAKALSTLDA